MKAGISFMLGLLLAFVVIFSYWLRTPHQLGTRWKSAGRGPEPVELAIDPGTR